MRKKLVCIGLVLVLAMSMFGALNARADGILNAVGDVYLSNGLPGDGSTFDYTSNATATFNYTAINGPDAQPNDNLQQAPIIAADGVYAAYFYYDVGSIWDWEPCTAGTQDVIVVLETVRGVNSWNSYNYTTSTNATMSCGIEDIFPDSRMRRIPTPVVSDASTSHINITWTGLVEDTNVGPNIVDYAVYRSNSIDGPYSPLGLSTPQAAGGAVWHNDTTVAADTNYYYKIGVNYLRASFTFSTVGLSEPLTAYSGIGDVIAPAAVTDLAAGSPTTSSLNLTWTAPGDDGGIGTATSYDVRYLVGVPVDDFNWDTATQATGEPSPSVAGTGENFLVPGLTASTNYCFALKTSDEVVPIPNTSPISNSPCASTLGVGDTTSPAAVTDLAAGSPTATSVTLTWTAPGDDGNVGTATTYDVRYLPAVQVTDLNWAAATQATGEPAPQVAGSAENFVVPGLSSGVNYCFALKTADEVPNWSPISNSPCASTTGGADTTSPAAVTLTLGTVTTTTVQINWTAPGDDGNTGTASTYDMRYHSGANCPVTVGNWGTATLVTGEPSPQVAGSLETYTVTGLSPGTDYCFALITGDEVPNWSPLSNSLAATTTTPDTTAPTITSVTATPSSAAQNVDINITANVTDAGSVATVKVNITDPAGGTVGNYTMPAGAAVNIYYYLDSYVTVGAYSFTIWASDASGNWASSTGSFTVTQAGGGIVVVAVGVLDKDNAPISGATVEVKYTGNGTPVGSGTTTAAGVYVINLGAGDYTITASKSGYVTASKTLSLTGSELVSAVSITLEKESDMTWVWILIIVVVVVIILLLLILMMRKKKKPAEEIPPAAPAAVTEPAAPEAPPAEGEAAPAPPAPTGDTKTCVSCGREIKQAFKLCPFCGASQETSAPPAPAGKCKNCSMELTAGTTTCPYCNTVQ